MTSAPVSLPSLRDDIILMESMDSADGAAPGWVIYDPLRHAYFQIDPFTCAILTHWNNTDIDAISQTVEKKTHFKTTKQDIERVAAFLKAHSLIDRRDDLSPETFEARRDLAHRRFWKTVLNSYLFFRIPLIRPEAFLAAAYRPVKYIYSRAMLWLLLFIFASGLFLVGRQWEAFTSTFTAYGTWQGQVTLVCAIIISKTLHEFGHAFTLHRYGGRVPSMGVAFLLMFPMLYTDTGDSWRLRDRAARLAVGSAGVIVELALACIALFLWSFAGEGPIKSGLFVLASTVWIGTLAINVSPFMKFDGYYLLSDYLGIANLQDRAFALGRWRLRQILFGLADDPPELFDEKKQIILVVYAYLTWLYRAFLFIGIAILVYHFFFKALGIILFAIEIWVFIFRPIWSEMRIWWSQRQSMSFNRRTGTTVTLLFVALAACIYPWRKTITVPALIEPTLVQPIYAPLSARLEALMIKNGQSIERGDILAALESPHLSFQYHQAKSELDILTARIEQAQVDRYAAQDVDVLRRQAVALESRITGIGNALDLLTVPATASGIVVDIPSYLKPGIWVNETEPFGWIISSSGARVLAFINESDISQIKTGASLTFVSDVLGDALINTVIDAETLHLVTDLDEPTMASVFGGRINVTVEPDGTLRPLTAMYRVTGEVDETKVLHKLSGVALIKGKPRSFVETIFRRVAAVLVQESGF